MKDQLISLILFLDHKLTLRHCDPAVEQLRATDIIEDTCEGRRRRGSRPGVIR